MRLFFQSISLISFFCLLSLPVLNVCASEEQRYRNELKQKQTDSSISYQEYQVELEKLLAPKPIQNFGLKNVLLPLGIIAIGVVFIFFIKQIRMNIISNVSETETENIEQNVRTEKAALAQADIAEESNDFRSALRYLYLSAILHLQERGILPYDKSLTNREYLNQTQTDRDVLETLGPAVSIFDEVWYGKKPCNASTVSNYRDLLQELYLKN